jgi:hypothetical protein
MYVVPVPKRRDLPLDRVEEVEVARLDTDQAGRVVFDARWWMYQGTGDRLLAGSRSELTEKGAPLPDHAATDHAATVAAMSRAVAAAAATPRPPSAARRCRPCAAPAPARGSGPVRSRDHDRG